jgi:hypothetical protein
MVEADAVFAQEVAPSGTLCLWLALVSHAHAAQPDDEPMMLSRAAPVSHLAHVSILHVEAPDTARSLDCYDY